MKSASLSQVGYTNSSFKMRGAQKTTKSDNVQLFRNDPDQIQGADDEVWHIGTVQHNVKKER
jgi:hypothetical protein